MVRVTPSMALGPPSKRDLRPLVAPPRLLVTLPTLRARPVPSALLLTAPPGATTVTYEISCISLLGDLEPRLHLAAPALLATLVTDKTNVTKVVSVSWSHEALVNKLLLSVSQEVLQCYS